MLPNQKMGKHSVGDTPCYEIVAYRIKNEDPSHFDQIYSHMHQEMAQLPGFVKMQHLSRLGSETEFTDVVTWESQVAALQGFELWKALPSTKAFMECVDTVIHSGHFVAGSSDPKLA